MEEFYLYMKIVPPSNDPDSCFVCVANGTSFEAEQLFASPIEDRDFNLYPNPARTEFFIDITDFAGMRVQMTVYDNLGQIVVSEDAGIADRVPYRIPTERMSNGMYMVSVRSEDGFTKVKPIVVMKE